MFFGTVHCIRVSRIERFVESNGTFTKNKYHLLQQISFVTTNSICYNKYHLVHVHNYHTTYTP